MKNPFPSSPSRPARFIFYCYNDVQETTLLGVGFCEKYAAQKFLHGVVGGEQYKWLNREKVQCDSGVVVYCAELEKIVEYLPLPSEDKWELPEPYTSLVRVFRMGERRVMAERRLKDSVLKQIKDRGTPVHTMNRSTPSNKQKIKNKRIKQMGGRK